MMVIYSRSDDFLRRLDTNVGKGSVVAIAFEGELLGFDERLWRRLAKCEGFDRIAVKLHRIASGGGTEALAGILDERFWSQVLQDGKAVADFLFPVVTTGWSYAPYWSYSVRLARRRGSPELLLWLRPSDPDCLEGSSDRLTLHIGAALLGDVE